MNLKDIVCDFEYADRLSELGLGSYKSSLFFFDSTGRLVTAWHNVTIASYTNTYTVAELGEMLPKEIYHCNHRFDLLIKVRQSGRFDLAYYHNGCCQAPSVTKRLDKKEANARAKLLIWLIENNHVNAEELNK